MAGESLSFGQTLSLLWRGKRAYWALNLANFGDGVAYFGFLTLLSTYLTKRLNMSDPASHLTISLFTGLVAVFMLNGGRISDRLGVRKSLTYSLLTAAFGRGMLSASASLGLGDLGNQIAAWLSLSLMAYGAGVLQTALYVGVKEYTDERTESMGWDLLYSLMNLGIVGASLASPFIRNSQLEFGPYRLPGLGWGIDGVFWTISGFTVCLALVNVVFFTPTMEIAERNSPPPDDFGRVGPYWVGLVLALGCGLLMGGLVYLQSANPPLYRLVVGLVLVVGGVVLALYLSTMNKQFAFFIFILLPVRTLFAHQFLTMPGYIFRGFDKSVNQVMEWIEAINPLVVCLAVPTLAVLTRHMKVINVMILGAGISASITFLLVLPPSPFFLFTYMVVFSLGEAIWASRFLEYVAALAPPGKTGAYMGVANLPWLLAKLTTGIYSGWMLARFLPESGPQNPGALWLVYAVFAMVSPIGLLLGRSWILRAEKRAAEVRPEPEGDVGFSKD